MTQRNFHAHAPGFTTVELMVTLIIGVLFIGVGYELFTVITRDGAAARDRSVASNIAAVELGKEAAKSVACTTSTTTPTTLAAPTNSPLVEPQLTSRVTWPYGCADSHIVKKVEVTITYGDPDNRKEIRHARLAES